MFDFQTCPGVFSDHFKRQFPSLSSFFLTWALRFIFSPADIPSPLPKTYGVQGKRTPLTLDRKFFTFEPLGPFLDHCLMIFSYFLLFPSLTQFHFFPSSAISPYPFIHRVRENGCPLCPARVRKFLIF